LACRGTKPFLGNFPCQWIEAKLFDRIEGRRGGFQASVADGRMFVPGEAAGKEGLAEPEMVGSGEPFGLREEVVDASVGYDAPGAVVDLPLEFGACREVLFLVEFRLEILF